MKRPALNNRLEEEASDCFSTSAPNSSQANQEDNTSPFANNTYPLSDSESYSDGPGKKGRKRQTYHKISDEIRLHLLESVKNGETLKSAAKRCKINYSSAKSILHTYRKEGRILKKSAQERTTAKKKNSISLSSASSELHMPRKMVKRETARAVGSYSTVGQSMASIPEESIISENRKGSNDTINGFYNNNQGQMTFHEEGVHVEQPKLFENYHFNNNYNFMENTNGMFNNMPQFQNFSIFSNETDSYNDMDNRWHSKTSLPEELGDPSAFLYMKTTDEKNGRYENEMFHHEFTDRNPLKNHFDAQHYLKEALRNSTNFFNEGVTVRKSSIDFF